MDGLQPGQPGHGPGDRSMLEIPSKASPFEAIMASKAAEMNSVKLQIKRLDSLLALMHGRAASPPSGSGGPGSPPSTPGGLGGSTGANGLSRVEVALEIYDELLDWVVTGTALEVHRALAAGEICISKNCTCSPLLANPPSDLDVFGASVTRRAEKVACFICGTSVAPSRFAPHLEKCMGKGGRLSSMRARRAITEGFAKARVPARREDPEMDSDVSPVTVDEPLSERSTPVPDSPIRVSATGPPLGPSPAPPASSMPPASSPLPDGMEPGSKPTRRRGRPRKNAANPSPSKSASRSPARRGADLTLAGLQRLPPARLNEYLGSVCGVPNPDTGFLCNALHTCRVHTEAERAALRSNVLSSGPPASDQSAAPLSGAPVPAECLAPPPRRGRKRRATTPPTGKAPKKRR